MFELRMTQVIKHGCCGAATASTPLFMGKEASVKAYLGPPLRVGDFPMRCKECCCDCEATFLIEQPHC